MLKYCINIWLFCLVSVAVAQTKDSVVIKQKYGLRIGIDLYNPLQHYINPNRKSFEIVADLRYNKKLYLAAEFGKTDNITTLDYMQFNTTGKYIKAGIDYNTYQNWLGMSDMVYFGTRLAYSSFNHTLLNYTVNAPVFFPELPVNTPKTYDNLNAKWIELVFGIKAETLPNLYLGFSFRDNFLVSQKSPVNFKNMFIPGFNRVYLSNSGVSFNYTLSYLIPFYKKK